MCFSCQNFHLIIRINFNLIVRPMPLEIDKTSQAWMSTQASELLRLKRIEEAQSVESQVKTLSKRHGF